MPAGTPSSTLGQTMERRTRRCPAARSSPDFASWIAGFFSSVVCRTVCSVTARLVCAQSVRIGITQIQCAVLEENSAGGSSSPLLDGKVRRPSHILFGIARRSGRSTSELSANSVCAIVFIAGLVLQGGAPHRQLALHWDCRSLH